ncbi:MAG: hypothetical protein KF802_03660 [Bdellovibrionaceae bacterium]|nr:hypothetical protein [Pseudobdellovibrionaceae bacterium]MBX3033281.1 hypothetical protein [Pseudobdellovibrionaceae bacterium]
MMMRRWKLPELIVVVGGFALLMTSYQNCAKTPLEKIEQPSVINGMPSLDLKSHICSQARFSAGETSKFVFIMDLSASNFGNWYSQNQGNQKLWYWDPSKATDAAGARFEAVKFFLDNCGNQNGAQFAFIGFSQAAGVLANGKFSCDNVAFGSRDQVKSHIDALKARQAVDEAWYKRWVYPSYLTEAQPDSLIYSVTSYTSASKCLEKLVVDDLTLNTMNQADRYSVFFISDGLPEDKAGTGCNLANMTPEQKTACYLETNLSSVTMTRTAAFSKAKDLRIQGIYYGDAGGEVPAVLDALSKEGGTSEVVKLQNFAENQNALCELVVTQNAIDYQPDLYTVINMNMRRENGRLVADSDMDGLSDEMEEALGYDPRNARSSGVSGILDGICERLGGKAACAARRAAITCNPNSFDTLGLTECDRKALNLDSRPGVITPGADSDGDGMPDFVEIIKGTDPGRADMTDDPDNDGRTTREEILRGSDPFLSDNGILEILLNRNSLTFKANSEASSCQQGDWTLSVDRLQTVRTEPVGAQPGDMAELRHGRDEQIVLVVYRLTPTNSLNPEIEYYGRYVRVKATGHVGDETLEATPSLLKPEDFKSIGKIKP